MNKIKEEKKKQENEIQELKDQIDDLKNEIYQYQIEKDQNDDDKKKLELSLQNTALSIDIVDFDNRKLSQENRFLNQAMIYQKENQMEKQNNGVNYVNCSKEQCTIF